MNSMKRTRHAFRNTSGEDIPPYALVRIADGSDTLKQQILDGDIPDDNDNSIYLANGPKTIAADKIGHGYWTTEPCVVAYDPAWVTPAAGQEWGPTADNWYLCEDGEGFIVLSVDSVKGLCRIGKKDRITEATVQAVSQTCGCSEQVVHGETSVDYSGMDVEFSKRYTVTTPGSSFGSEFPELTYSGTTADGEHVWKSPTVTLATCYDGIRASQLWFVAHAPVSIDATDYVGGNLNLQGTLKLVSITNSCAGDDADLDDITGIWEPVNSTFNPLAGTEFRINDFLHTGRDYALPCIVCLSAQYGRILLTVPQCATDSLGDMNISGPAAITAKIASNISAIATITAPSGSEILSGGTQDISGEINSWINSLSSLSAPAIQSNALTVVYSNTRLADKTINLSASVRSWYLGSWVYSTITLPLQLHATVAVSGNFALGSDCGSPVVLTWGVTGSVTVTIYASPIVGLTTLCGNTVSWSGTDNVDRPPGTYTIPAPDESDTGSCGPGTVVIGDSSGVNPPYYWSGSLQVDGTLKVDLV